MPFTKGACGAFAMHTKSCVCIVYRVILEFGDVVADVVEEADVIEELYITAEGTGSTVELMSQDSEEGEMLMRAFNGLAAILGYRMG